MSLEKELSDLDWEKEYTSLQTLLSKDMHMYRILMYTSIASSVIFTFVLPLALIITIPAAIYFGYTAYTRKKEQAVGIVFTLSKKQRWNRPKSAFYRADDPESIDDNHTFHLFIPDTASYSSYIISDAGLKQYAPDKIAKHFIVYEYIFDTFKEGDQLFFVFSPINTLVAFYLNGKITRLLVTSTLGGGEYKTSIGLKQETLKHLNREGFELLKPDEDPESL